jgi:hypothetical protein
MFILVRMNCKEDLPMKFSNSDWEPHEQAAQITQADGVNQSGPLSRSPT